MLVMEVERLARGDAIDQGIVAQTFKYSNTKIITPIKPMTLRRNGMSGKVPKKLNTPQFTPRGKAPSVAFTG